MGDLFLKNRLVMAWMQLLAVSIFVFYSFAEMNIINILNTTLTNLYNLSASHLSLATSLYLLANGLCLIPVGILLDRFSTKKLLFVAILAKIFCDFIILYTHSFTTLLLMRTLSGAAHAFALLSAFKIAATLFPSKLRGLAMGIPITLGMCGGAFAQAPCQYILRTYGWHAVIFTFIFLGIISLWLVYVLVNLKESKLELPQDIEKINLSILSKLLIVVKNSHNWIVSIYICLLDLPLVIFGAIWGERFLVQHNSLSQEQAAISIMMLFVGSIIGMSIMGYLSDFFKSRKKIARYASLCGLFVAFMCIVVSNANLWFISFIFLLLGLFGGAQTIGYTMLAEMQMPDMRNMAMGITNVVIVVGGAMFQTFYAKGIDLSLQMTNLSELAKIILLWLMPLGFFGAFILSFFFNDSFSFGSKSLRACDLDTSLEERTIVGEV